MRPRTVSLLILGSVLCAGCAEAASAPVEPEPASAESTLARSTEVVTTPVPEVPLLQLVGKVTDDEGSPVADAMVTLGSRSTMSAADGFFDLTVDRSGSITISKPGWVNVELDWDGSQTLIRATLEPFIVRGLRVGGDAARDEVAFAEILDLADVTAINALLFDTKQEGGTVLYDTQVKEAHDIGAVVVAYDPRRRLTQARERGLYVITRIVTFEDSIKASAAPEQRLSGPWLDPNNVNSWEYPLALAVEACEMGFDEIQFDYVRFPSGVASGESGQLDMSEDDRVGAIAAFLEEAKRRITPLGCAMSADVFGITVSSPDDQGIGQRPEELSRHVDVFSPMVYPSHYSDGWLGFDTPNDHPYDVTADAIDDGLARIDPGAELRPWLQAFWWTNEQIRRSIQAAEDRGVGWILWNARSNYSAAALPTDAEVTG